MTRFPRRVAVVLAGGRSRRFGSDKLAADLGGRSLLEHTLAGLPDEVDVVVVGPDRPLVRAVRFVREEPPGGGPAAALVAGVAEALLSEPEIVWVLPGDAPAAGPAAFELDHALTTGPHAAVVAVDDGGRRQPLQLALRAEAAERLVEVAGPEGARNGSARDLIRALDPPCAEHRIAPRGYADVDTPDQLAAWRRLHLRNEDRA